MYLIKIVASDIFDYDKTIRQSCFSKNCIVGMTRLDSELMHILLLWWSKIQHI